MACKHCHAHAGHGHGHTHSHRHDHGNEHSHGHDGHEVHGGETAEQDGDEGDPRRALRKVIVSGVLLLAAYYEIGRASCRERV